MSEWTESSQGPDNAPVQKLTTTVKSKEGDEAPQKRAKKPKNKKL